MSTNRKKSKKKKKKINPHDYIGLIERMTPKTKWGCAFEAMVEACKSYNGCGNLKGWIGFKVKMALLSEELKFSCVRRRQPGGKQIYIPLEYISIEEAGLWVNGEKIKQMIDRHHLEHLMAEAGLNKNMKRRLRMQYFEDLDITDIAKRDGVTLGAVSQTITNAMNKLQQTAQHSGPT